MAWNQKKKSSRQSISGHYITEFRQTRGHQGNFAATFQVRTDTQRFQSVCKSPPTPPKKQNIGVIFNCPSFFYPALPSTSEPRGPESQPTPEDKAARWAPARCTTWPTASTNSATNTGPLPSTRSAHRDMDGGVDLFQSAKSH